MDAETQNKKNEETQKQDSESEDYIKARIALFLYCLLVIIFLFPVLAIVLGISTKIYLFFIK